MERPGRWSSLRNALLAVVLSKALRWLLLFFFLLLGAWFFRAPLLRGVASFLVKEDAPCHVDAVYVLGGASDWRGQEAGAVYRSGLSDRFRFTGAPVPKALKVEGIERTEAEQTRLVAVRKGVPDSLTVALNVGTSTYEEAGFILSDALASGCDTVMIVSSGFHLRRIAFVFRKRFREKGITVVLHGARNGDFEDATWWRSEEGLLMVNNEYVKLMYYAWKY